MYKVFFNRTEFLIGEKGKLKIDESNYIKRAEFVELPNLDIFKFILAQNQEVSYFYESSNLKKDWDLFQAMFTIIEAAGGLVYNEKNELLTIFRNGVWDLPKGKVEKGESVEEAAIREVEEETGVRIYEQNKKSLQFVYHIYELKNQLILKKTYWYNMLAKSMQLVPQAEEGITKVAWMSQKDLREKFVINTYPSIKNLLVF